MTYPGGKANIYQWLINHIPPHQTFISTHLGNCAVMRFKRPAQLNIGLDLDSEVIEMWQQRAFTAISDGFTAFCHHHGLPRADLRCLEDSSSRAGVVGAALAVLRP